MNNSLLITCIVTILLFHSDIFSKQDSVSAISIANSQDTIPITDSSVITLDTSILDSNTSINSTDTLSFEDTPTDSLTIDSLRKIEQGNRFLWLNRFFRMVMQKYPDTIDSLFNPYTTHLFQVYHTDGINFSDIMQRHLLFTSIPTTLSSNQNTFLYYGFPAAHVSLYPENSLFSLYSTPSLGLNLFSSAEIKSIHHSSPGQINFSLQPWDIVKPETSILWEGGVFKENLLNIRFARPITEQLRIGIFSNFQSFQRKNYSHNRGSIYTFFKDFHKWAQEKTGNDFYDSLNIAGHATNPLTNEHVTTASLSWTAKNGMDSRISYKYADIHNDIPFEYCPNDTSIKDTTILGQIVKDTIITPSDSTFLAWRQRDHYSHWLQLSIKDFPLRGKIRTDAEIQLKKNVNKEKPVSIIARNLPSYHGGNLLYGGGIKPQFIPGDKDTIDIKLSTLRDETTRYDNSILVTRNTQSILSYRHRFFIKNYTGLLQTNGGLKFIKCNGQLETKPVWNISLKNSFAGQNLLIYAKQDNFPPHIPYNNYLFTRTPGKLTSYYRSYGVEAFLQHNTLGLIAGICYMDNEKDSIEYQTWPNGIPPYEEPNYVISLTPIFGRWHGISFSSEWMFADKKPHVKSNSLLSFHITKKHKTQHVFLDFGLNYWSERDSVYYAGYDKWYRSIFDIHMKATIQIKTFRLFYKVDNILNRKIAYVPGSFMPGLVFRWGFNWLIQG